MTTNQTQSLIDGFCTTVGWNGDSISFVLSTTFSGLIGCSVNPEPLLIITDRFRQLPQDKQVEQFKDAMCLLLARLKFENDKIQTGSPEWRYWAFKCGLLKTKGQEEFNTMRVLSDNW